MMGSQCDMEEQVHELSDWCVKKMKKIGITELEITIMDDGIHRVWR